MTVTTLILAAALAAQSPGAETSPTPASGVQKAAAIERVNGKAICKRITQRGTRFTKRICATAEQWEEQRRRDIEITREFQRNEGSKKAG
ncbi:MAG: hypothetical protein AAFQ27_00395 [Pseudomonadota bacterium]